jgi:hypothetical protein
MKKIVRLTENDLTRIIRKVNKKSLRESSNRKRMIRENKEDLTGRLKSIFPNLETFIEDDMVCITLSNRYDENEEIVDKRGLCVRSGDDSNLVVGDFDEQFYGGESQSFDMDTNRGLSFEELIREILKTADKDGSPYEDYE